MLALTDRSVHRDLLPAPTGTRSGAVGDLQDRIWSRISPGKSERPAMVSDGDAGPSCHHRSCLVARLLWWKQRDAGLGGGGGGE